MKTYPIHDSEQRLCAFEVPNFSIGRRAVCRVLRRIPGLTLTREPRLFSWLREDVFCEFELGGATYVVEEPFGDNSRYWVGPEPVQWLPQTEQVHRVFLEW